jgi:regulatory protein
MAYRPKPSSADRPAGPPPDEASLRDAALAHLARYATTEAGLKRVLQRRIERWARRAEAAGDRDPIAEHVAAALVTAGAVIARLAAAGAVNDQDYAVSRARSLTRAGRSRRAVAAHLAAKGVASHISRDAAPDDPDTELAAALTLARRRRIGPFRGVEHPDGPGRLKELAILARAGFPQPVAARALAMGPDEAEERVAALRR